MICLYFSPFSTTYISPLINQYNNQLFETITQLFTHVYQYIIYKKLPVPCVFLKTHTNLPFSVPVLPEEMLTFVVFVAVVFLPSVPETWALAWPGPHVIRTTAQTSPTAYICLEQSRLTLLQIITFFMMRNN